MSQFADFAIAADCRISLEGMHGTAQAADRLLVKRTLFQAHAFLIHRLQELLRALEKEFLQIRAMFFEETQSTTSVRWYTVPLF